jgi:Ca2+-binding EF-hand superfamily protein
VNLFFSAEGVSISMNSISEERLEQLRERFASFDLAGTGKLDFATLAQVSAREGTFLDRLLATVLIRTYDSDQNNEIDFEEFVKFCEHIDSQSELQLLLQVFKLADRDHSGTLELDEVRDIARQMGMTLSSDEAQKQLLALDQNGDHMIDINEFCQLLGREIPS